LPHGEYGSSGFKGALFARHLVAASRDPSAVEQLSTATTTAVVAALAISPSRYASLSTWSWSASLQAPLSNHSKVTVASTSASPAAMRRASSCTATAVLEGAAPWPNRAAENGAGERSSLRVGPVTSPSGAGRPGGDVIASVHGRAHGFLRGAEQVSWVIQAASPVVLLAFFVVAFVCGAPGESFELMLRGADHRIGSCEVLSEEIDDIFNVFGVRMMGIPTGNAAVHRSPSDAQVT
jgi:hypothetical protein